MVVKTEKPAEEAKPETPAAPAATPAAPASVPGGQVQKLVETSSAEFTRKDTSQLQDG